MANWAAGSRGVGPGVKRRVFRIMLLLYRASGGWGGVSRPKRGFSFCQLGFDQFGDQLAVGAKAIGEDALLDDLHGGAHVARAGFGASGSSEVGDGGGDDLADLVLAGSLRHVSLDHGDLGLLL